MALVPTRSACAGLTVALACAALPALAGPPKALRFATGQQFVPVGQCSAAAILVLVDAGGSTTTAPQDMVVSLTSGPPPNVGFFTDPGCTSPTARLTIPLGASTATFYFSDAVAELTVLTASEPTVTAATQFAEFYFSDSDGGVDDGGFPGDPDGGPVASRDGGTGPGEPGARLEAMDLTVGCDCAHARGAGLLTAIAAWLLLLGSRRSSRR